MTIEFNDYGVCVDSSVCYIALSWGLLITTALLVIGYKIYKRKKNKYDF
mgnify:CR=1